MKLGMVRKCRTTLALTLLLGACGRNAAPPVAPPVEVGVVKVASGTIPLDFLYTARTRGVREVEVRARVSGILQKRYYREGERVAANALLFKIDPEPFAAEVRRLRGLLDIEQARLTDAADQRERLTSLFAKGFASRRDRDAAVTAHAAALAAHQSAKAALQRGELDLAYTEVRAPIAGVTGSESRSEGSLVEAGADSSLLTRITQSDQLYVDFSMPEREADEVRAAMKPGPLKVSLITAGRPELPGIAQLDFLDNRIDGDSGTVQAHAVLDNRTAGLSAGQFVQARIDGLMSAPGIHIPLRAVLYTADGTMLWVVDEQNRVQPRPVKLGQTLGNLVEVTQGLKPGERCVVDGILKLQPGAAVKPVVADPATR